MSADVEKRLATHNAGRVRSTKAFIPWRIVHVEKYDTRLAARERERLLKTNYSQRIAALNEKNYSGPVV